MPPNQQDPQPQNPSPTRDWQSSSAYQPPVQQPTAPSFPVSDNGWQQPVHGMENTDSSHQQVSPTGPPPPSKPAYNPNDDMHKPEFRGLNLSAGEKVLSEMHRHPIGVLQIYAAAVGVLLALLVTAGALIRFSNQPANTDVVSNAPIQIPVGAILGIAGCLAFLIIVIAAIAIKVYHGNRLYLTNESVIQRVQTSLFSVKEQQITLGNIEDVSFEQRGIFQHMFNYGTLRLSTEGEETTYYFYYANNPREQAGQITNAQEEFVRSHAPTPYH